MSLDHHLLSRLEKSELWIPERTKQNGHSISPLVCPECGLPEAWTFKDRPRVILCNRQSRCGARTPTLSLFPDILTGVERDVKIDSTDTRNRAREYLRRRGLTKSLEGLEFEYWLDVRGTGKGAVMFKVGKNSEGESVWNGRIIDPPAGEGKSHTVGGTTGMFWKHPAIQYDREKPIFVTEGVIDALSLIELGKQAIAVLSAGVDPRQFNFQTIFEGNPT